MKIEGQISFLAGIEETVIEISCKSSGTKFIKVTLTPEQLSSMLSRIAYTPCELEVRELDRVGKTQEHKKFEFKIPEGFNRYDKDFRNKISEYLNTIVEEGWIPDGYFGSQNSFFQKDGESWARTTIRRYV